MLVTLEEMKNYLRVDDDEDDGLITTFLASAERMCMDILRTDEESGLQEAENGKTAVMYTVAYLYEHREEADHHAPEPDASSPALRQPEGGVLMEIDLLNVKVTFQKNSVVSDSIGNRKNVWEDYYTCHATVSGEGGQEKAAAGLTVAESDLAFTVRFCKRAAEVTADGFRILFQGEIYNIVAVDHMNYKKKALKFRCEKARR